jgi:DNA-binding transcriptional regulator YdaS (Cro superfamily)
MDSADLDLKSGVKKAIEAVGSGGKLGKELGISRAAVNEWKQIPAKRVREIARLTGVPAEELRPDLYGPEGGA